MVKIIGLGKFILGAVCITVFINGFVSSQTWGELGFAAFAWLGGAASCFIWAYRDRKRPKGKVEIKT